MKDKTFEWNLFLLSANASNLEESKDFSFGNKLTLTKGQSFELNRIQSICRQQIKCCYNDDFCLWLGRKHCGKRRKCWLPEFFLFPMVSKNFSFRAATTHKCVKGLNTFRNLAKAKSQSKEWKICFSIDTSFLIQKLSVICNSFITYSQLMGIWMLIN